MMTNTQPNGTESPTKSDSKAFSHNLVPRISIEESRVNSPMKTPFNVNAAEFVPLSARNVEERGDNENTAALNVNAPAFVPGGTTTSNCLGLVDPSERVKEEICQIIHSMGMTGIRVTQLPHQYRRSTGKWLILSDTKFSTLSDVIDDIKARIEFIDKPGRSSTDKHATVDAVTTTPFDKKLVVEPSVNAPGAAACPPLVIGHHADRIVMDKYYGHYSEELNFFRQLVVAVVRDFCLRNQCSSGSMNSSAIDARRAPPHQRPAGLALSLFAAEWDRYFHGKHGLKEMRERFGVMKLMPFLHSIKELDIVGTHPEVRVRMKPEYLYSSSSAIQKSPVSHAAPPGFDERAPLVMEGYGTTKEFLSPTPRTQRNDPHQSYSDQASATALLAQQLLQSQQQLMTLISLQQQQLARMGASSTNQELESLVSGLLAGVNDTATVSGCGDTNGMKVPQQPVSTATPRPLDCLSPAAAASATTPTLISKDDLKQLLLSVVEEACTDQGRSWDARQDLLSGITGEESDSSVSSSSLYSDSGMSDMSFRRTEVNALDGSIPKSLSTTAERGMQAQCKRNKTVGMPVSSVKRAWKKAYPGLSPLDFYMTYFGIRKLKFLLLEIPELLLIGSGGSMRVATFAHVLKYCDPFPSDCRSGAAGLHAADETFAGESGLRQQLHKLLFDLVAEKCQEQQIAELATRATFGDTEARNILEKYNEAGQSLSEAAERAKDGGRSSSKPAPIDTTVVAVEGDESVDEVIRMVPEPEGILLTDIERVWYEKYGQHLQPMLELAGYRNASRLIHTCPGLRVSGHGMYLRCRVGKKQQQGLAKTPICLADDLLSDITESPVVGNNEGNGVSAAFTSSSFTSSSSSSTPASGGIFGPQLMSRGDDGIGLGSVPTSVAAHFGQSSATMGTAAEEVPYIAEDAAAADALLGGLLSYPRCGRSEGHGDAYGYSESTVDNNNSFLQQSPLMSMEALLAEVDTPPTKSTAFGASPCNDKQTGLMSTMKCVQ
ncbi:hypothetical protein Pmar_PMAR003381 [Perkinsus marinus ATCC 50983]|uniref:HTH OST-type domain-containing protein n=1 Tax=Perkinsus marinus (strain ATCC 50983 / TXsc) TaxID=423536 RepID=C5KH62_PERM5|nr:hypothetical protein Pmar_PMAR003381 [Perkinsus marinus ATCC 50983]EER15924.1 hypothetical protein Pmar_PMAR003381 [Perkinsus marinus ATCC 50983]|eukprot:XP_002784128.1 hypothetical protein Pmar_PMAR003381 [Perkinsus marinus ATCC 50983]